MTEALWTCNGDHGKRPNDHPLRSPSGAVLTRDAPEDHPSHRGLRFTIELVDGDSSWEEHDADGVLRHQDEKTVHRIKPDRETVVTVDRRTVTDVQLADDAVDWSIDLMPTEDVVLAARSERCDLSGSVDGGARCAAERSRWLDG